jgi:hypothetical protein
MKSPEAFPIPRVGYPALRSYSLRVAHAQQSQFFHFHKDSFVPIRKRVYCCNAVDGGRGANVLTVSHVLGHSADRMAARFSQPLDSPFSCGRS